MGRTFIYDRSGTSMVEDGVSQAPFLGSAIVIKGTYWKKHGKNLAFLTVEKRNIITASY